MIIVPITHCVGLRSATSPASMTTSITGIAPRFGHGTAAAIRIARPVQSHSKRRVHRRNPAAAPTPQLLPTLSCTAAVEARPRGGRAAAGAACRC